MADREGNEQRSLGTILRVMHVIRELAEADESVTVTTLARTLQLAPSTVHRLLKLLASEDFVSRDSKRREYKIGPELLRLSALIASRSGRKEIAEPYMKAVLQQTGEACMLVEYLPSLSKVWIEASVHPPDLLRFDVELHTPHSLAWGATGRSVLAFLPRKDQEAILDLDEPSPATGHPLPPRTEMLKVLDEIKARGYVVSKGQKVKDAVGIGSPVFDRTGRVIGSLCIPTPAFRFSPEREKPLSEIIATQAKALSRALGFSGAYPGG